jgi:excisionase family DNA binding protein
MNGNEPKSKAMSPYLTIQEAMEYTRLSRSYLYNLTRNGTLRSYRVGKRVLLRIDDVMRFIEGEAANDNLTPEVR